jgi:phosphoserine phosphatase
MINPEAIAFIDIDGTALRKEGKDSNYWENESWFLLTAGFGASIEEHKNIYGEYRDGITHDDKADQKLHDQMSQKLIELWKKSWGANITIKDLLAVCLVIKEHLSEEFKTAIAELISNNILVIAGTSGFELAAQAIAEALNLNEQSIEENGDNKKLEYWFGNTEFLFNKRGGLTKFKHDKDLPGRKVKQAQEKITKITSLIGKEIPVIAVGDGPSDLGLFFLYYGIAFQPTNTNVNLAAQAKAENWNEVVTSALLYLKEKEKAI